MTLKPAQFPQRVWIHTLDRTSVVPVHALIHFEPEYEHHEYLSKAESDALVSQARKEAAAEAYEDALRLVQIYRGDHGSISGALQNALKEKP
jgi:hypothetical protein